MTLAFSIKKQLEHMKLDIKMTCEPNTLTAIVGPSGSGKTTLIRMLAGLETPDSGNISCNNANWFSSSPRNVTPPQHRNAGLVFQDYTLFPHLTVEKNIRFAAVDSEQVPELLHSFNIEHIKNKKPHSISGGERQRAALCQTLARRPVTLLLDEPFSALDVTTRHKLQEMLLELKVQLHVPIIHVTHDLEEATLLGDSVVAIEQGKISPTWFASQLQAVHSAHNSAFYCEQFAQISNAAVCASTNRRKTSCRH